MPRNRKRRIKPFPTYDKILPIDLDEFITAVNWAMNAGVGKAVLDSPNKMKIGFVAEYGSEKRYSFTDVQAYRCAIQRSRFAV